MQSVRVSSGAVLVLALVVGLAVASAPTAATAKVITVNAGESIQAAVDAAAPHDTVKVMPGDYIESHAGTAALRITKPLRLLAVSAPPDEKRDEKKDEKKHSKKDRKKDGRRVRLLPNTGQTNGIVVEPANPGDPDIDGVEIRGFTVEGFAKNGIWLVHTKHFKIENNESINNLRHGIWPTLSANGEVKRNVSYGSRDSALWVEGSQNVRVLDNDLHHSPIGLEITISQDLTIKGNDIHDNTVGMGLFHPAAAGLPADEFPPGPFGNWEVKNNYVHDNNLPNTVEEGDVALLPPGIGILMLGVDNVDLLNNRVENNEFVGIGMLDWCVGVDCFEDPPPPGFEDTALDYNRVIGSKLAGNHEGTSPPPGPLQGLGSDILFVGADLFGGVPGVGNCASRNKLIKTPGNPPPLVIALPTPLPECD